MANFTSNIARNDLARAWVFENGINNCNNDPQYSPCVSFDALTQDAGDRTRIECPDPYRLGAFIEVGTIPGEISRLTTTMTSRMTRDSLSRFRQYFNQQCALDIQLVYGLCNRPNIYGEYDKILVFEDTYITSFGTDALSALASGDRAEISETVDISVGNFFEIVQLIYQTQGLVAAASVGPLIDGVVVDVQSCGVDCTTTSDGCENLFVTSATGQLLYTSNAGTTWNTTATSFAGGGGVVTGIDTLNNWVWSYNNGGEIAYLYADGIRSGSTQKLVTGLSTAGLDQDSGWEYGLVVGTAGFVGYISNPALGIDSIADAVTTEDLVDVHIGVYDENRDFALAVGGAGVVIWSRDGLSWAAAATTPAGDDLVAGYAKTSDNWLVASETALFCTEDCGESWMAAQLPCPVTAIHDIRRTAGRNVLMLTATDTATGTEVIMRSTDGGNTWMLAKSAGKATSVANVPATNVIVPCDNDPNRVWVVGDLAGAGAIIQGQGV